MKTLVYKHILESSGLTLALAMLWDWGSTLRTPVGAPALMDYDKIIDLGALQGFHYIRLTRPDVPTDRKSVV